MQTFTQSRFEFKLYAKEDEGALIFYPASKS